MREDFKRQAWREGIEASGWRWGRDEFDGQDPRFHDDRGRTVTLAECLGRARAPEGMREDCAKQQKLKNWAESHDEDGRVAMVQRLGREGEGRVIWSGHEVELSFNTSTVQ